MFEISIVETFTARHQLRDAAGALEPLHQHTWRVAVTVAGPRLDEQELLVDFSLLRHRLSAVLARLDDQNLNELAAFSGRNPSAEILARHVAERLVSEPLPTARLICVEVEEQPGCVARYRPDGDRPPSSSAEKAH